MLLFSRGGLFSRVDAVEVPIQGEEGESNDSLESFERKTSNVSSWHSFLSKQT